MTVAPLPKSRELKPGFGAEILGVDIERADDAALDGVVAIFHRQWQEGDVLMWDNHCTLHTGALYDDSKYFRVMHRLWVKGDRPR